MKTQKAVSATRYGGRYAVGSQKIRAYETEKEKQGQWRRKSEI